MDLYLLLNSQFEINAIVNPEIESRPNNMRKTRISEFSNALFNQRVRE